MLDNFSYARIRRAISTNLSPAIRPTLSSLNDVAKYGMNNQCGLLVNSSRGIIYADSTKDFAIKAREQALDLQQKMKALLSSSL
jgi:orotidine-5'-phosphate decarboxylase